MQPPIKGTRVLGVDPGIRTGTKCAALDETGKFLDYFLIFQERDAEAAKKAIAESVRKHSLKLIAVGNGTASHETQEVVAAAIAEAGLDCEFTVVDEDGASVYSASDVARDEFPELDLTVRGAISIGRRLQDPLAELVKIDPKSIGVGLYQHDVNQKRLSETLDEVVGSVVNNVGVNLNTASASLLKYVSGINAGTAKKIVKYREANGTITGRDQLKSHPRHGRQDLRAVRGIPQDPGEPQRPRQYLGPSRELRPRRGDTRPGALRGASRRREAQGRAQGQVRRGRHDARATSSPRSRSPTATPAKASPSPCCRRASIRFEDLAEGMKVTGKVKNVVDFGAFVEIGIKESALIHVSEMSDRFVKDPMEVLKVGDVREFRIISIDLTRKRIGLSLKSGREVPHAGASSGEEGPRRVVVARPPTARPAASRPAPGPAPRPAPGPRRAPDPPRRTAEPPRRPVEDDGMTYNPFAELLKNRGK